MSIERRDPAAELLARLNGLSDARIALGRAGQGLPTKPMLDFQLAHSMARDAVYAEFNSSELAKALDEPAIQVTSAAEDRETYLKNPNLGRRLSEQSAAEITPQVGKIALVLADGLSAVAAHRHGPALIRELKAAMPDADFAPVVLASMARVALGDDIGERMRAKAVVMLIGERPGLSVPDSLGVYITWAPKRGRSDAERNCLSNIRDPGGLSPRQAADKIAWLLSEAEKLGKTGVALKDRQPSDAIESTAAAIEHRDGQ